MRNATGQLIAAMLLCVAACQAHPPQAPSDPIADSAAPPAVGAPLSISAACYGPFKPGDYAPLACTFTVTPATLPTSTDIAVFVDASMFGLGSSSRVGRCPACGGEIFDLDLHIPKDMAPGRKVLAVRATDTQGRSVNASAAFDVIVK